LGVGGVLYKRLVEEGFVESIIYDVASGMVSRYGIESEEAAAGVFLLLFSWNRFFYGDKNIEMLERHVEEFIKTTRMMRDYILALRNKSLESVDFDEELKELGVTVEAAIRYLFYRYATFLRATGASKALHLLLPQLIVMWDSQIRKDYEIESSNVDGFLKFQRMMKKLLERAIESFMREHRVERDKAIRGSLRLRYGSKPKSLAKLIDEFNWRTRGENKLSLLK